jgi:hypothetical protein
MKLQPISYEPLRRDGFQDVEWLGKQLRSPSVISAIGGPHPFDRNRAMARGSEGAFNGIGGPQVFPVLGREVVERQ